MYLFVDNCIEFGNFHLPRRLHMHNMETEGAHLVADEDSQVGEPESRSQNSCLAFFVQGGGLMMDSYEVFVLNLVLVMLTHIYSAGDFVIGLIASSPLIGAFIGQLIFGYLGNPQKLGRTKSFVITLSLVIFGALLGAFSLKVGSISVCYYLAFSLVILGIGIGGEYPLSASISAESKSYFKSRGNNTAAVFSMQGIGNVMASSVVCMLLLIKDIPFHIVWRLAIGLGAIPCVFLFRPRLKMHKSSKTVSKPVKNDYVLLSLRKSTLKHIVGTSLAWFFFDITFYGNALFAATVENMVLESESHESRNDFLVVSAVTLIITVVSLPGYFLSVYFVDSIGTKRLQLFGFTMLCVIYAIMGIFLDRIAKYPILFVALYSSSFFFSNFGPNATTFIMPTQLFDEGIRSLCHGIAAASGKLGAALGAFMFDYLLTTVGMSHTFLICTGVSAFGLIVTATLT